MSDEKNLQFAEGYFNNDSSPLPLKEEILDKIVTLQEEIERLTQREYAPEPSIEGMLEELKDVKNELIQSFRIQYRRGSELTGKQRMYLRDLYRAHRISLSRGFKGLDEGVTDKEWHDIQVKVGLITGNFRSHDN